MEKFIPFSSTEKYQTLSAKERFKSGPRSAHFSWFVKQMDVHVKQLIEKAKKEDTTQ